MVSDGPSADSLLVNSIAVMETRPRPEPTRRHAQQVMGRFGATRDHESTRVFRGPGGPAGPAGRPQVERRSYPPFDARPGRRPRSILMKFEDSRRIERNSTDEPKSRAHEFQRKFLISMTLRIDT